MISEKTVELNLTAELLNWLFVLTRQTHYVIAPSQRAEGRLGYDAGFYGSGPAVVIQFKRAHVSGSAWCWHLNRTKLEDQHARLQRLEASGAPVYYALPYFHRIREVVTALDWQVASPHDKLATCADFIASTWKAQKFRPDIQESIVSADDMRPYAEELVAFLDAAFKKDPDRRQNRGMFANQTVASFAAIGMVTMGWTR